MNLSEIEGFGQEYLSGFELEAKNYLDTGQLIMEGNSIVIADEYWPIADRISSDLFMI